MYNRLKQMKHYHIHLATQIRVVLLNIQMNPISYIFERLGIQVDSLDAALNLTQTI